MKKLFSSLFITSLALVSLSGCNGYETLKTPFDFSGTGINLFGSESKPNAQGAYEVVVNAPAGTSRITAMELFDTEAKKDCQGRPYKKVITAEGKAEIRDFGVKGVNTQTINSIAPTITGYVECQ